MKNYFSLFVLISAVSLFLFVFLSSMSQKTNASSNNPLPDTQSNNTLKSSPENINTYSKSAADFVGISHWLNSKDKPLTISQLKGNVVLIDFWTYTCINCIQTLPYITKWYDRYKDKGFVVIGIHTPEFPFEKNTDNVQKAIKQYNIQYPVAQDNDYKTWNAYGNQYWPAFYLIDKKGTIRYQHFGEGDYDKTEAQIQHLLKE